MRRPVRLGSWRKHQGIGSRQVEIEGESDENENNENEDDEGSAYDGYGSYNEGEVDWGGRVG